VFRRAVLSLTLWYLAIIMGLSLGFSLALYQVFSRELNANEQRQEAALHRNLYIPFDNQAPIISQGQAELTQSLSTITWNLVYFNLFILVAGGAISYFLSKRTLQPIQEATESQNRFTADASHELRTPLTAIRTELEVSLRDPSLTLLESKALHRSTLEEISKLEALSNALLRLAHYDPNLAHTLFKPSPLADILKESAGKVAKSAEAKKITLEVGNLPGVVNGDFWSLVELFAVFLDNAIKYSPEKTTVSLTGKIHDRRTFVTITDHGRGISHEDLPHIFDRFYQAERSRTKDQAGGYGLGLSIAKKIIDLHQGGIEVRSQIDHGSTFTISLPLSH